MKQYRNQLGFNYTEDEINEAIEGSNITFEQYLEAKGLSESSGAVWEPGMNRVVLQNSKPSLETDLKERFPYERQIEHFDISKMLKKSAFTFAGGWGRGPGQEERVVKALNNWYSGVDDPDNRIKFKEMYGGMDVVGLYIDGKHVDDWTLGSQVVSTDRNAKIFQEIQQLVQAHTKTGETPEILKTLANDAGKAMDDIGVLDKSFRHESTIEKNLESVLPTNWEVKQADWYRDALKITNNHGVTRHFNLESNAFKKQVQEFILLDIQKTSDAVNKEMDFKQDIKTYLTPEKLKDLHKHGGYTAIGIKGDKYASWEDLLDNKGNLDSDDADRFIDMIFDDMGIDQGFAWFDKASNFREKYQNFTEDQMKILIKQQLEGHAAGVQMDALEIGGAEVVKMYNEIGGNYDGKKVKSFNEFLHLYNLDVAKTFKTRDERDLAEANLMLMQDNLSSEDKKKWEDQRDIARENIPGYVEYIDRNPFLADGSPNPDFNKRINVPEGTEEFFKQSNPNAVYNQANLDIIKNSFQQTLTGDSVTDFQLIEEYYNKNVASKLFVEEEINTDVEYRFKVKTVTGVEKQGGLEESYTTSKTKYKTDKLKLGIYSQFSGETGLLYGLIDGDVGGLEYGPDGEMIVTSNYAIDVQVKDSETGEWLSEKESKTYFERIRDRLETTQNKHTVAKYMYLLNQDLISTWGTDEGRDLSEHAKAMVHNSLGAIIGEPEQYQRMYGPTKRNIVDATGDVMSEMGMELTRDQSVALDRTTWETIVEGGAGSVGILLEFAIANKATAALRTARLFGGGKKSIDSLIKGWKSPKYRNAKGITLSESQILTRANKLKITPLDYQRKYGFATTKGGKTVLNEVTNYYGKGQALLAESIIEGAKFASLPSSAGHRVDAFWTGAGFGFMGQALAPVFGQITRKGISKKFGQKGLDKYPVMAEFLMDRAGKFNLAYQTLLKGPTSFVAGSEMGELTKGLAQELLGKDDAFAHYMEHHWGDYSDLGQRLISNYVLGTAFGFSHHMFPTVVPKGKGHFGSRIRWFNDYRTLSDIERIRDEAFDKNFQKIDYIEAISPSGKTNKVTPEEFVELKRHNKAWKVDPNSKKQLGDYELRPELQVKEGDSPAEIRRKRDLESRNSETYQIFDNMYRRAEGHYDMLNPIKGQMKLETMMASQRKFWKERGVDIEVLYGTNETLGKDKRASFEPVKDPKTGKDMPGKIRFEFNVEQLSLGLMPHEIGHAGMFEVFTKNARFKGEFLEMMSNIAKEINIGVRDGKTWTLYDQMVEMNGKWDIYNRPWENARISEWEMFSYVAEELAKPQNYVKLRKAGAFRKYKELLNDKLAPEIGVKEFDLKTEGEIVKFFGDYIQTINKGKSVVKFMKNRLTDVIDMSKTEDTKNMNDAWAEALGLPEAPTTTLQSSVKMTELRSRMQELVNAKNKNNGKWPSKTMENEFKDTQKEWKELRSLAEQSKTYKKDRSNEEIAEENTRLTKVIETLLEQSKGSRIKDLPDGPIKDNLIVNIRGNNIGVLPRVADAIIATAKKRKTFEEVPSKEELINEAEIQMLQLIRNYNPKLNDAILSLIHI